MISYKCDACKRTQEAEWVYSNDFQSWSHMPPVGWQKLQSGRRVGCCHGCAQAISKAYDTQPWKNDTEDQIPIDIDPPATGDVRGR